MTMVIVYCCLLWCCNCKKFDDLVVKKLNYPPILFLSDRHYYERMMMRIFFDIAEVYINVSDGKSALLVMGGDGYNTGLTLKKNIITKYNSVSTFIAMLLPEDLKLNGELQELRGELIVMRRKHGCLEGVKCFNQRGLNIIFVAYGKEAAKLAQQKSLVDLDMIVHCPHGAPMSYFAEVDDKNRSGGAVLIGGVKSMYPMRVRWKRLIDAGKISGAVVHKHPTFIVRNPEMQVKEYIETLHKHKIILFCSRIEKYQLAKFAEAAIAGGLIIATLPDDDPEFWAECIVQVSLIMSDDELVKIVSYWLNHDKERIAKAKSAQKAVLSKYTTVHTTELIAKSVNLHLSGFRGVVFNYPYVDSCYTNKYSVPSKWCSADDVWKKKKKQRKNKKNKG